MPKVRMSYTPMTTLGIFSVYTLLYMPALILLMSAYKDQPFIANLLWVQIIIPFLLLLFMVMGVFLATTSELLTFSSRLLYILPGIHQVLFLYFIVGYHLIE